MLKGLENGAIGDPSQRSAFRSSWTQPEGLVSPLVMEAKVVDNNSVLWTVDVVTQFEAKRFLNIQVASPYMHIKRGEGIYAMPEIGSKCHVCIPSDGAPPFVLDFIMSSEPVFGEADTTTAASYAGGRVRAKPGDIVAKGRDGNFVILHRGGVLQIGASELAQRIYIPLRNLISDISQNYRHYNTGGSENWFIATSESETNPPTIHKDTYRLLAGDARATIRITHGLARDIVQLPELATDVGLAGIGGERLVEVTIAPEGFGPDDGSVNGSTPGQTMLQYYFDKNGNAVMSTKGSVLLVSQKKLRVVAKDNIDITTSKNFSLKVDGTSRIDGGKLLELTAKVTKINGGSKPVATVGSVVECRITLPLAGIVGAGPASGSPVVIPPINPLTGQPQTVKGTVISGNPTILG